MNKIILSDIFIGNFPITQRFGVNASYYSQFGLDGHEGQDRGMPNGTPLICPFDEAIVVRVVRSGGGAYGKHIVLWDSKQKAAIWYCHCQTIECNVGDVVNKHNLVAYSNNTGNSTGPHLHWSICKTDDNGVRLNQDNGFIGMLNPDSVVDWRLENPTKPTKGEPMNNELEECFERERIHLKMHNELVDKCNKMEKEAKTLVGQAEELKNTISKQAGELIVIKKENKSLNDKLETAGDKLITAEALREKWYELSKQSQKNLKSCQLDLATFKTKVTKIQQTSFETADIKTILLELIKRILKKN